MQETKQCQNCHNDFTIEPDDFAFYEKMGVPAPTWCPRCRMIRRTNFRNVRSLYKRSCALCGKGIITMYHIDDPAPVFCNPCWNSDNWDQFATAMEIDWSKPFLSQWYELFQKAPRFSLWQVPPLENCEFTNYSINNKNCYLSYSITGCEDVRYSENIDKSRNCLDNLYLNEGEGCYENIDCNKNYNTMYTIQSKSCIDSWFLFDCVNCSNCFMSSNLRNKQYVFRGEQLNREEYMKRLDEINTNKNSTIESLNNEFKILIDNSIHKYADTVGSVDVTGNHITNSRNVINSFGIYNSENIKNGMRILNNCKDSQDLYGLAGGELIYDCVAASFQTYNCAFSFLCNTGVSNVRYTTFCLSSTNLFGSVGLKKASYCILNKQYTKEEYEELVPKIIEHMNAMPYIDSIGRIYKFGEFFPVEFSPYDYNESIVFDLYPTDKQNAVRQGYSWKENEKRDYNITLESENIPDSLDNITDDILNETIRCQHKQECDHLCTFAFRITQDDLQFYRDNKLPLPRTCPNCRHYERLSKREPVELWHRVCMCDKVGHSHGEGKCDVEFDTSYAPERPEKVYCERCYQQEVL